jgi:hypothetical protein
MRPPSPLSVVLALVLAPLSSAQLREPGQPASFRASLPSDVPTLVLPVPDAKALREASESGSGGRFQYGVELDVGRGLEDSGRWDTVPSSGENVWRLELVSPGAFSLGVVFRRFDPPPGAQVFLYHPLRRDVLGAYGESTENPNGVLAVQPLRGDRVVIEYVEPPGTPERPELVVGTLVHDYLDVLARMRQGDVLAASCLVDVNCPIGSARQDIKRAVIWMCGGGGCCSGSILNNTAEDQTPYMMVAEHCGNMTNGTFVFDYERTGCAAGPSSQSKSLSGATQLAVSQQFDGQLYRLNQTIPASYEPFFAGWSLVPPISGPMFGISHPSGFPKKIQVDWQAPLVIPTRLSVEFDIGAVQPGSSGSPLFDKNERVIGSCSTGGGGCSSFSNYGRFDLFYSSKGLAPFLDPLGWGVSGIDGFDPILPYAKPYSGAGVNLNVYTSVTEPRLGTTWTAQIDTSSRPTATKTVLIGHDEPAEGALLAFGQALIDTTSPLQFSHSSPIVAGLSTHSFPLPSNMSLVGRVSYTQAFIVGGGTRATNGIKLVLNF